MIHDFQEKLAWSHSQSDEPWWDEVYTKAFPDLASTVDLRHDGWHQRAGRDRALILTSGRALYVDEKVRREAYEDFLTEIWSVYPIGSREPYKPAAGAVPGWARKPMDCDYIAYAIAPLKRCHLLPFPSLRTAVNNNLKGWIDMACKRIGGYRWVVAHNSKYDTISIVVPLEDLITAMSTAMTITWGD
jgi:hypothetical protein